MANTKRPELMMVMCIALAAPACATTRAGTIPSTGAPADRRVAVAPLLPDYVRQLPLGSAVRLERANGRTLRGTLLKATDVSVVIQPRTRITEAPVEVPLAEVLGITPEKGRPDLGRAIAAGAAAGAGTALAVFFVIVSLYAD